MSNFTKAVIAIIATTIGLALWYNNEHHIALRLVGLAINAVAVITIYRIADAADSFKLLYDIEKKANDSGPSLLDPRTRVR